MNDAESYMKHVMAEFWKKKTMSKTLEEMEAELAKASVSISLLQKQVQDERRRTEKERLIKAGYYIPLKHGIVREDMWNLCVDRDEIENGMWISKNIIHKKPTWAKGTEMVMIKIRFTDDEIWIPKDTPDYENYDEFVLNHNEEYIQEL